MKKTKLLIVIMVLLLFSSFAIGSAESDEGKITNKSSSTKEDKNSNSKKKSKKKKKKENDNTDDVLKKGGSYEKDGLKLTFVDCITNYTPSDDEYELYKPSKGKKFIACTFEFENNGDSDEYVSIYDFNCYADNKACNQEFISTEDFEDNDNINDSLSPGRTITFTTFYAVPKKAKDIQLEYEPSFWSDEKLIIQVK